MEYWPLPIRHQAASFSAGLLVVAVCVPCAAPNLRLDSVIVGYNLRFINTLAGYNLLTSKNRSEKRLKSRSSYRQHLSQYAMSSPSAANCGFRNPAVNRAARVSSCQKSTHCRLSRVRRSACQLPSALISCSGSFETSGNLAASLRVA